MGRIEIVQDASKFKWVGVLYKHRFSDNVSPPTELVKKLRKIDEKLDLKFYLPTQKWRLIRNFRGDEFCTVWELEDNPNLGLRKEPGDWMIEALKMADMQGAAANRVEEVDKHNAEIDKKVKEEQDLIAKDMAKELRKPLQDLYDYGEKHDSKRFL